MAYCHKEVRKIAKEMAGCSYEELAKNDEFHRKFPCQNKFIAANWKLFVNAARHSLLQLLAAPTTPEGMKVDIEEIYIKDRMLQEVKTASLAHAA